MQLRELTFPIAVSRPSSLIGGRNAGLHKRSKFDFSVAEYFLKGGYDNAKIYDARGKEFEVVSIEFRQPNWVYYFLQRADNFFIFPIKDKTDMVRVDMVLQQTRELSLNQFCNEFRKVALEHPTWWKRHSSHAEIEQMFSSCTTFAQAINDIGVLDPTGREKLPGKSTLVVDLR